MTSSCGSGPSGIACRVVSAPADAVGSAITSGTESAVHGIAESMASAADSMLHTLTSIWMDVSTPSLTGSGSPVTTIQSGIQWITVAVAVACVIAAAARMAIRRRGEPFSSMALGLVRLVVVSAAAAGLVELAGQAGDELSTSLMNAAHLSSSGWSGVVSVTAITTAFGGGDGTLLIISLVVLLSALIQLMLMILRIGLLIVLTGTLPLAAAASMSDWGETWWRKHLGWLAAWLLYKPAAALLFAGAITLTNSKQSLVVVAAGFMLLAMMVLLLPALLKLIVPATAALGAASGGGLALGAAGAAATGAIRVSLGGGIGAFVAGASKSKSSGSSGTAGDSATGGGAPTGTGTTVEDQAGSNAGAEAGGQGDAPSGSSSTSAERPSGESAGSGTSGTSGTGSDDSPEPGGGATGDSLTGADEVPADNVPLPPDNPPPTGDVSGSQPATQAPRGPASDRTPRGPASGATVQPSDDFIAPGDSGAAPQEQPQQAGLDWQPPADDGSGPSGSAGTDDDGLQENGGQP